MTATSNSNLQKDDDKPPKKRIVVNLRTKEDQENFEKLKKRWGLRFDYDVLRESFRRAYSLSEEGLLLNSEDKDKVEALKEELKLINDLDIVRIIVHRYFSLDDEKKQEINLDPSLELLIDDFLKSNFYKMRHGIFNRNDFVNRAIIKFYERIKSEINLNNAAFRTSLPEKEKVVVQALLDLTYQLSNKDSVFGVDKEEITKYLKKNDSGITEEDVSKVLFSFVSRQLVIKEEVGDRTYFSIPL